MSELGPLSVIDTGRGLSVIYNGRHLYSSRDPQAAPLAAVRRASHIPSTLYLIPSPCLCYGLAQLLAKLDASSAILCVDTDPLLHALAQKTASALGLEHPRLVFVESTDPWQVLQRARHTLSWKRVELLVLGAGYTLDRAFYDSLCALLQADAARSLRNRISLARMGRLWTKNLFSNLGRMDWNRVSPSRLASSSLNSKSMPTAVCGAGPSLDDALPFLRAQAGRIRILACDTACGPLASAGIQIDAVVCLEGQVYNVADFLPMRRRDACLWADVSSHPSGFSAFHGPVQLVASTYSDASIHERLARSGLPILTVPPLGSVGVLALRLARVAYGGPLLVFGLDFAYPQGQTHCANSPSMTHDDRMQHRLYRNKRAWAASFREGTQAIESGWQSDPALAMYAQLAAAEIEEGTNSGRSYLDLRGAYSYPLPMDHAAYTATSLWLDSLPTQPAGRQEQASESSRKAWERDARAFLTGELAAAQELRTALAGGAAQAELQKLLSRADFCWIHFPDPERVLAMELDALKRVAAECSYWMDRLHDALSFNRA